MLIRNLRVVTLLLALSAPFGWAQEKEPAIGFSGTEFYRLDWDTLNLRIGDLNGDGRNDVAVVNNARARIECLLQRADTDAAAETGAAAEGANDLPNDLRFESVPYSTEKRVFSMELGDLNGDGRTDMAYYGDPRELVVVYQDETGKWGARRTFDIADGATQQAGLSIADFNGDGRNDIVLLGVDGVYFIYQSAEGKLDAPIKEAGVPEGALAVLGRDFNGDGRVDLLYACGSEITPFVFRFQMSDGRLGPQVQCKAAAMRAAAAGDVDGDKAEELAVVQMAQGRLVIYKAVTEKSVGGLLDGPFDQYTLRTASGKQPHALAFVEQGPGADSADAPNSQAARADILITDADAAEIELFTQGLPGLWNRKTSFPTLKGVTDILAQDVDGDTRTEVLVISPEEGIIGVSRFDEQGKLSFPRSLSLAGKPTCMTAADVDGNGKHAVLYASTIEVAGKTERSIRVLKPSDDGYQEALKIPLEEMRADPDGMLVMDINWDGLQDILLFAPYQEMRVLKGSADGQFQDVSRAADYGKGLVQGLRLKNVYVADIDGDGREELLAASKNFARALRLDAKDRLEVADQFNGRAPNSQIVAVAALDLDGDAKLEIILVDSANKCLTALKRDGPGVFQIVENLQIGPIAPERTFARSFAGEAVSFPAIIILGQNDFSVLQPGRPKITLRELASYETPIRNGRLDNVGIGNISGSDRPEIVASEGTKQTMELLGWVEDGRQLRRQLAWPVFEAKSFERPRSGSRSVASSEPREFEIGDVTSDGKPDIVLLIHDRVLVYVQE